MESKYATNIWQTLVDKLVLRYTTMLSDGDSKSFDAISKINVHGDDTEISKKIVLITSQKNGCCFKKSEGEAAKKSLGGKGKLTNEK